MASKKGYYLCKRCEYNKNGYCTFRRVKGLTTIKNCEYKIIRESTAKHLKETQN